MRIVQLPRPKLCKVMQAAPKAQVGANHVLQRAGNEKILLFKPQAFALFRLIIRVKDLGEIGGGDIFLDSTVVITLVEYPEAKQARCLGLPQPQQAHCINAKTGDRCIVGHAFDDALRNPANLPAAGVRCIHFRVTAQLDLEGILRPGNLPGVAQLQPVVGPFDLPAILQLLIEDAKLITNTVTDRRNLGGRQGVHITGGQPPQSTITQTRFFLLLEQLIDIDIKPCEGLLNGIAETQVDHVVREMGAGQVFSR